MSVAIVDGTGSTAYCRVTSLTLASGVQGVSCPLNPNNFASYCQVTSKHNSAVRANPCLVAVKFCSEARWGGRSARCYPSVAW